MSSYFIGENGRYNTGNRMNNPDFLRMKSITLLKDKLALELITKSELAKRCACTTRHIDNLTASGIIQKIKLGMCSRYDWQDVVASLKARSGKGTA